MYGGRNIMYGGGHIIYGGRHVMYGGPNMIVIIRITKGVLPTTVRCLTVVRGVPPRLFNFGFGKCHSRKPLSYFTVDGKRADSYGEMPYMMYLPPYVTVRDVLSAHDVLAAVRGVPATVYAAPSTIHDVPTAIHDFPGTVRDVPTTIGNL